MVSFNFLETKKTRDSTNKLPKIEASKIPKLDKKISAMKVGKIEAPIITNATPKLEPELNPNTYGPANGFLNKVCINKPEIDKPIPTKAAVIAFGNRKLIMIYSQVSFTSPNPNTDLATSFNGIATCPKLMFNRKANTKQSSKTENRMLCCAFFIKIILVFQRKIVGNWVIIQDEKSLLNLLKLNRDG